MKLLPVLVVVVALVLTGAARATDYEAVALTAADDIIEARTGPPTSEASRALMPAWNSSAPPAATASTRNARAMCAG